ncbi:apolipoprotein D-like [Arapaima gigas]
MSLCHMFIRSAALFSLVMLLSSYAFTVPIKVVEETECCKATSSRSITSPITGYQLQKPEGSCVLAVIFISEGKQYCCNPWSSWVRRMLKKLQKKMPDEKEKLKKHQPSSAKNT